MHLHKNPLTARAQTLRKAMTQAERRLWFDCLKDLDLGFRKQRPIGQFIVDFYSPKLGLVIEVDGQSHNAQEAQVHDQERTDFLRSRHLTVLRFSNAEVMTDLHAVRQVIVGYAAKVHAGIGC